jgi:putative multicomponent Na+:H+ antiporter subunit B
MDSYIYVMTALLPIAASMVVFQVNPYHALVIRGILGAIAALVYTVLGAADVALTEALVGTLLAITLYAVAVRSSLVFRLGIVKDTDLDPQFQEVLEKFRRIFKPWHLRVELLIYLDYESLQQALIHKEIHATCVRSTVYHTTTRLRRLYEILQPELGETDVSYFDPTQLEVHL